MEIQYLGHSCFRIKGKKSIIVTDPYDDSVGMVMPEVTADIVTVSHNHQDHNNFSRVKKTSRREPFVISSPGEYEVSEIFVFGTSTYHDAVKGEKRGKNTIFSIIADGLKLVHLGDLGHLLEEKKIEQLGEVDILFIPTGGEYTLGAKEAVELVGRIQPKVVIPMHYLVPGVNEGMGLKNTRQDFLEEIGVSPEPIEIFNVLRETLPEEREVVIFKNK